MQTTMKSLAIKSTNDNNCLENQAQGLTYKRHVKNKLLFSRIIGNLLMVLFVCGVVFSVNAQQVYTLDVFAERDAKKHENFNDMVGNLSPKYILGNTGMETNQEGSEEVCVLKEGKRIANIVNHASVLSKVKLLIIEIPKDDDVNRLAASYPKDLLNVIPHLQYVYIKGSLNQANVNAIARKIGRINDLRHTVLFDGLKKSETEQ